jgi:hypothetical protein
MIVWWSCGRKKNNSFSFFHEEVGNFYMKWHWKSYFRWTFATTDVVDVRGGTAYKPTYRPLQGRVLQIGPLVLFWSRFPLTQPSPSATLPGVER